MAENLDPKEVASFEELMMSNIFFQEAIMNLLDAKGILKKEEVLEEIKRLRATLPRGK
ncbi:MAG: hypothetical protein ABGX83_04445 [Nitrospira sp.]